MASRHFGHGAKPAYFGATIDHAATGDPVVAGLAIPSYFVAYGCYSLVETRIQ